MLCGSWCSSGRVAGLDVPRPTEEFRATVTFGRAGIDKLSVIEYLGTRCAADRVQRGSARAGGHRVSTRAGRIRGPGSLSVSLAEPAGYRRRPSRALRTSRRLVVVPDACPGPSTLA